MRVQCSPIAIKTWSSRLKEVINRWIGVLHYKILYISFIYKVQLFIEKKNRNLNHNKIGMLSSITFEKTKDIQVFYEIDWVANTEQIVSLFCHISSIVSSQRLIIKASMKSKLTAEDMEVHFFLWLALKFPLIGNLLQFLGSTSS